MLALAETTWVLQTVYDLDSNAIATAVEMLLQHKQLVLEDDEVVAAAVRVFLARPSLGFSDYLMLELARKAGHSPLGTFDRTLAKLDGAHRLWFFVGRLVKRVPIAGALWAAHAAIGNRRAGCHPALPPLPFVLK